jgi:hypothetical protein
MRLKLIFVASLVAALIGTAIAVLVLVWVHGSMARAMLFNPRFTVGDSVYLVPVAAGIVSAIFVYRHTSRWRKLQSLVTALLVVLFSWIALMASLFLF